MAGDDRPILIYDDTCGMCRGFAARIVGDGDGPVRGLGSSTDDGGALLRRHGLPQPPGTIVLVEAGRARLRSDAVMRALGLRGGAGRLAALLRIVPRPLRDWGYDQVAKRRHRRSGPACAPRS